MHGSPPQTLGLLSIPGKKSPRSRTTHCSSCAFSARVIAANNFSVFLIGVHDSFRAQEVLSRLDLFVKQRFSLKNTMGILEAGLFLPIFLE
jgi:hypothetical protein